MGMLSWIPSLVCTTQEAMVQTDLSLRHEMCTLFSHWQTFRV